MATFPDGQFIEHKRMKELPDPEYQTSYFLQQQNLKQITTDS